jgi:hypothetical protein
MIVYNVDRRFFSEKSDAEAFRKRLGLKPSATLKIAIDSRIDLAGLLNALCDPAGHAAIAAKAPLPEPIAPPPLLDRAYVDAQLTVPDCVPLFLIKDDEQRKAVALDRFVRQVAP